MNEASSGKFERKNRKEPAVSAAAEAGEDANPSNTMWKIKFQVLEFRPENQVLILLW